ncbi:tRNA (N6-threonylcarbamoyladenosine(37)-N6)-methyltransferase TrmO [Pasteurellaceae bacterium Macca]|nr:tRNA (N6-threonylcarbamoyladenosine(37)-N6)-methyltransferase TrmO [Pasteurellaceae bacterium Macca]
MSSLPEITLKPIGILHSPYGEKFAVPRQANLVQEGKGTLRLLPPYNTPDAVRGLSAFSHLWLIFQFHHIPEREWHATVRPPRLGGNERVGVFASRATHRPNPIGLSKVALEQVEVRNREVLLHLGSVDLVDGTPILDIKPYLAYADSEPQAHSSFAQEKPSATLTVSFTPEAEQAVENCPHFAHYRIQHPHRFLQEIIAQDPRPAYQQGKVSARVYGMKIAGCNVKWQINAQNPTFATVLAVEY